MTIEMDLAVKANLELQVTAIQMTKARTVVPALDFYSAARTMKILHWEHLEEVEYLAIYGQPRKQSY
jgi:hypothetical protein